MVQRRARPASSVLRRGWNGGKTALLLAALGGLLVAVGSLFGRFGALVGLALGPVAVAGT